MTGRDRLENRRDSRLVDFEHGAAAYTAGYSLTDGGRLAELFISGAKVGSDRDALVIDGVVLLSIALQLGADAAALARSLSRLGYGREREPASVVGAALDAVLEDLTREQFEHVGARGQYRQRLDERTGP